MISVLLAAALTAAESAPRSGPGGTWPCDDREAAAGAEREAAKVAPRKSAIKGEVPPKLVKRVHPTYPEEARAARLETKVYLQGIVEKDGTVGCLDTLWIDVHRQGEVHVEGEPVDPFSKSFAPVFDAAAKDAVRKWRFKPAMKDGEAISAVFMPVVDFKSR